MSRKRIPLNQNGCTANFRIGVPFGQNLHMLKKYTKKAGIETKITPHMFRHSFATYLIEEGVDVSCVQQILGHSSIKTTQIYIHIAAKKQADILRELHPRNNMKIVNVA